MHRTPFLLALLCGVAAAQAQQSATHRTRHFEVVAPTRAIAIKQAGELERAAGLFRTLFGDGPAFGRVTLLQQGGGAGGTSRAASGGRSDQVRWTLAWRDPRTLRRGEGDLMTHEAAHQMFLRWIEEKLTPKARERKDRYGTALPDWFDEAVAVWHEPTWMRAARRVQVRQKLAQRIPFERFFASEHPLAEELARGKLTQAVWTAKQEALLLYYGQAMALLEYLVQAGGGRSFVRKLALDLAQGKTMAEILAARMTSPSLRTVGGLERGWAGWVRRSYRAR